MLTSTLSRLQCPRRKRGNTQCDGTLQLFAHRQSGAEVHSGHLACHKCQARFPILAGVAIVVDSVRDYLLTHVKGIAQAVSDSEIPREFLKEYLEAKSEIQSEHIEEDLEAERVNALYVMIHYLKTKEAKTPWWQPLSGPSSALIDSLIRQYWDQGPFAQMERWAAEEKSLKQRTGDAVELGCGVGGLYRVLKPHLRSYLGIDSSFASIAIARHLTLGVPYKGTLQIPEDLLKGPVSRKIEIQPLAPSLSSGEGLADFIVADLEQPSLVNGQWDLAFTLNTIDMLDEPSRLPVLQSALLKEGGLAIQSGPYIWHPEIARKLRNKLPSHLKGSSAPAVEWLYQQAGLKMESSIAHIPWLFFKHLRQIEIYSVHAFTARK